MATNTRFDDMINEYLPEELLREEMIERNYLYKNISKDDGWLGGDYIVPFQAGQASSVSFGSLVDESEISQSTYVRGKIEGYVELWGALVFNYHDLVKHKKINEQNFLRLLPDEINMFLDRMEFMANHSMLNGGPFAVLVADGENGYIMVDRPEYFTRDMKITIEDGDSVAASGFVTNINVNTGRVDVVTTLGGATPLDMQAFTVAQGAAVYLPGGAGFASIPDALLSHSNGGSEKLYGHTKTHHPHLQAVNIDGTAITADNILEKIFDAHVLTKRIGKGRPTEVWMSYKHWGSVLKILQSQKGAFYVMPGEKSTTVYPWEEVWVGGPGGKIKLVAINEMRDDVMPIIDWRALKFASNGLIEKVRDPDGNLYYKVRATTGYKFICDIRLFGQLVVRFPSYCGIIHSISY